MFGSLLLNTVFSAFSTICGSSGGGGGGSSGGGSSSAAPLAAQLTEQLEQSGELQLT
jgi:hypothetical protein